MKDDELAGVIEGVRVFLCGGWRVDMVRFACVMYETERGRRRREAIIRELVSLANQQDWAWDGLLHIGRLAMQRGDDPPAGLKSFVCWVGLYSVSRPTFRKRGLKGPMLDDVGTFKLSLATDWLVTYCGLSRANGLHLIQLWSFDHPARLPVVEVEALKKRLARFRKKSPALFGTARSPRLALSCIVR